MYPHTLRRNLCRLASLIHSAPVGPIFCVGMVRNEIDIIDAWIEHICALFDQVIIYDHLSTDGTRQRLENLSEVYENLIIREYVKPEHEQSRLMSETFFEIAKSYNLGWVFFLDADEFVMNIDHQSLKEALRSFHYSATISIRWKNAYPVDMSSRIHSESQITGWFESGVQIRKIAANLRYSRHIKKINQGNHAAKFGKWAPFKKIKIPNFSILHLPIRSKAQLRSKITTGVEATKLLPEGKNYATHWQSMHASGLPENIAIAAYWYGSDRPDETNLKALPPKETFSGPLSEFVSFSIQKRDNHQCE